MVCVLCALLCPHILVHMFSPVLTQLKYYADTKFDFQNKQGINLISLNNNPKIPTLYFIFCTISVIALRELVMAAASRLNIEIYLLEAILSSV